MTARRFLLVSAMVGGIVAVATTSVAARTICDEYGNCYNTSGRPIYPSQPYGYDYGYGYSYNYYPSYWPRHHRHHYDYDDEGSY